MAHNPTLEQLMATQVVLQTGSISIYRARFKTVHRSLFEWCFKKLPSAIGNDGESLGLFDFFGGVLFQYEMISGSRALVPQKDGVF